MIEALQRAMQEEHDACEAIPLGVMLDPKDPKVIAMVERLVKARARREALQAFNE